MKVIKSGWNNREFMVEYEKFIYDKLNFGEPDIQNCEKLLGRNFSFFIFQKEPFLIGDYPRNYMVLFDADDGSGIALDNCKLYDDTFTELMKEYNVEDYIIFKMQYSSKSPHNDYYPYADKTHPLGYFPYFPHHIEQFKQTVNQFQAPTIDFLWMGTVNYEDNPPVWPEGLDKKHWQLGQRLEGYEMVMSLKESRPDLNIVVSSDRIPYFDYLNMVMQSKVCLELPGVGNFTTRFFENLQLGKCILGKELYLELPYEIKKGEHYIGVEDWTKLEDSMDWLMDNPKERFSIMKNVKKLQPKLSHQYAFDNMIETINKHLTKL